MSNIINDATEDEAHLDSRENPFGFSLRNKERNLELMKQGFPMPKIKKTGTTIVGMKFKDGVILGADTRETMNSIVSQKDSNKVHYIADHVYCCGAGTSADTEHVTDTVSAKFKSFREEHKRDMPVVTAMTLIRDLLYRYGGEIEAALILGGVDINGSFLYAIYPEGSVDKGPYVTMGSGCVSALSMFEIHYKSDMSEEEGKNLVCMALTGGIVTDPFSGNNFDIVVIRKDSSEYLRNYMTPFTKPELLADWTPKKTDPDDILGTKIVWVDVEDPTIEITDIEIPEEPQTGCANDKNFLGLRY